MSSFISKCLFYKPEDNAKSDHIEMNFEGLEMQNRVDSVKVR